MSWEPGAHKEANVMGGWQPEGSPVVVRTVTPYRTADLVAEQDTALQRDEPNMNALGAERNWRAKMLEIHGRFSSPEEGFLAELPLEAREDVEKPVKGLDEVVESQIWAGGWSLRSDFGANSPRIIALGSGPN